MIDHELLSTYSTLRESRSGFGKTPAIAHVRAGKVTKTIKVTGGHPIRWVKASKNGQIIMCSVNHATFPMEDCHLVGYDLKAGKWLPKVVSGKIEDLSNRGGFSLTNDGRYVVFAHQSEEMPPMQVIVWDVRNGSGRTVPAHSVNGIPQYPMNYLFSESLKAVVVLYNGGDLAVYDLNTLKQMTLVKTASQIIIKAHLSQDGSLFISNGKTINSILVYDLARGKRVGTLALDMDTRAYTVSADNNFLLFGAAQIKGMVQVYLHREASEDAGKRWATILNDLKKKPAIFGKDLIEKNYYTNPPPPPAQNVKE